MMSKVKDDIQQEDSFLGRTLRKKIMLKVYARMSNN